MITPLSIQSPAQADVFDVERIKAMRLVAEHAEGGWFVGDEELGAVFTGAGTITANGLVTARADVRVDDLKQLRRRLSPDQALQSIQVGTDASAEQTEWAAALGFTRAGGIPTMTMDLREAAEFLEHPFRVRRAERSDSDAMAQCIADGFELDTLAESAPFANAALLARPEVTGIVVESASGEIISAGMSTQTTPDAVGLYAIATRPEHRRQGHGAAVTRALMAAAREQGASVAYLQASPQGAPVYSRIGFTHDSTRTYMF